MSHACSLLAYQRGRAPREKREFRIINIKLNLESDQAEVYKFSNRKDDAVFNKDSTVQPAIAAK